MKNLLFSQPIVATGNTFYIPVPCRGNVKSVRVACDVAMVATETLTLGRGTDVVNTLTRSDRGYRRRWNSGWRAECY